LRKRGFILVLSLLLCALLFVVGIAFLGLKANQYRSASSAQMAVQAKAFAEAGLEDFRLKLDRDSEFPPQSDDSGLYNYHDKISVAGTVQGAYTISIDSTYAGEPFNLLVITCTGEVGETSETSTARRVFRAEVDVSPFSRSDATLPNPNYRRLINVQDLGGS
jgi:type II secretory pathway component PulK